MSLELAIKDHAAALLELAAAIRSASGGGVAVTAAVTSAAGKTGDEKPEDEAGDETIYWVNNKAGTFGTVEGEAAYLALKKKDKDVTKTTETVFNKKVKAKEAADAEAAEEATAKAKGKSADDDAEKPTKQDLAKAFQAYLPGDLADKEKAKRRGLVKEIIDRFGGTGKVTELDEEHWALAINIVQRLTAGQKFDIEDAEFEAVETDDEDPI